MFTQNDHAFNVSWLTFRSAVDMKMLRLQYFWGTGWHTWQRGHCTVFVQPLIHSQLIS